MTQALPKSVFISYSREDTAVMKRIASRLQKQGLHTWVDNEKLIPGTPVWEAELEKALKTAGAVVVIMSPASKNSDWVRREISLAEQNHKRIFPVLAEGDEDSAITIRLITKQFVDIRQNESAVLDALAINIHSYLDGNQPISEISGKEMSIQLTGFKKYLGSWFGRVLIGVLVGLSAGQIMAVIPNGYFEMTNLMPLLAAVGGFAGLLLPPHRASFFLALSGFIVAGLIFGLLDPEVVDANYFIGTGIFFGLPLAAILARILYWRRVIK